MYMSKGAIKINFARIKIGGKFGGSCLSQTNKQKSQKTKMFYKNYEISQVPTVFKYYLCIQMALLAFSASSTQKSSH